MRLELRCGHYLIRVDCDYLRLEGLELRCLWWERSWRMFYEAKPGWRIGWCIKCGNNRYAREREPLEYVSEAGGDRLRLRAEGSEKVDVRVDCRYLVYDEVEGDLRCAAWRWLGGDYLLDPGWSISKCLRCGNNRYARRGGYLDEFL